MYIKIMNLTNNSGMCDYKGLDIKKIIGGSQVYDIPNNLCLIETTEEITPNSSDVTILTKQDYDALKADIEKQISDNKPIPTGDRISALEVAMANMLGM